MRLVQPVNPLEDKSRTLSCLNDWNIDRLSKDWTSATLLRESSMTWPVLLLAHFTLSQRQQSGSSSSHEGASNPFEWTYALNSNRLLLSSSWQPWCSSNWTIKITKPSNKNLHLAINFCSKPDALNLDILVIYIYKVGFKVPTDNFFWSS